MRALKMRWLRSFCTHFAGGESCRSCRRIGDYKPGTLLLFITSKTVLILNMVRLLCMVMRGGALLSYVGQG
jgi:hypothetical protein